MKAMKLDVGLKANGAEVDFDPESNTWTLEGIFAEFDKISHPGRIYEDREEFEARRKKEMMDEIIENATSEDFKEVSEQINKDILKKVIELGENK